MSQPSSDRLTVSGTRQPGEFCWFNMLTPRAPEAREFFSNLLGWTYFEMPGIGHGVMVGGHHVGGLFDLDSPQTPPGTPPVIGVMVKVDSAQAVSDKVIALGGTAKPVLDILGQGKMAVLHDPNGAQFDVWEPINMPGTDVDGRSTGAPSWFETMTSDVERATRFYGELFGWTAEVKPMSGWNYTTFKLGEIFVAGMMPILPAMGRIRPHWGVYFTVKDAAESESLAAKLGGKICLPTQAIPGVGRLCGISSPQGVMFYVIEYVN